MLAPVGPPFAELDLLGPTNCNRLHPRGSVAAAAVAAAVDNDDEVGTVVS